MESSFLVPFVILGYSWIVMTKGKNIYICIYINMHWVSKSWDFSIRITYDIELTINCDWKLTLDIGNNQRITQRLIEHSFTRNKKDVQSLLIFKHDYIFCLFLYFDWGIRYWYLNPPKLSLVYTSTLNCRECLNLLNKFIPLTGKQDIKISLSVDVVIMLKIFSKNMDHHKRYFKRFVLDE